MDKFKVIAPTRVDFAGGTLDLWPLYTLYPQTKTVNCAIDLFAEAHFSVENASQCHVVVGSQSGEHFTFRKPLSIPELEKVPVSVKFPVAIVSRYLEQKTTLPKVSIKLEVKANAPLRSGLGGSSSLCVAIARGMSRIFNDFTDQGWRLRLLDWVKDLEAGFLKTPTGTQDYLAALYGGVSAFCYSQGGVKREEYPTSVFDELQERTLVLFSGEMHHSGLSNWEIYKGAIEGRGEILAGLSEIKKIADHLDGEFRRDLIDWNTVGKLISDEWEVRKNMFKVETPRLAELIEFLKTQSISGARVCGAASGGSIVVLVEPSMRQTVIESCEKKGIQVLETQPTQEGVSIH